MDDLAKDAEATPLFDAAIDLYCFYAYGYGGRTMYAVRAPFATPNEGLVGRVARIEGKLYRIVSVLRQIGGPIAAGEPIGVEVSPVTHMPSRLSADALEAKGEEPSTSIL
jgi:hypothetical protein